jgi:hypothetical protein
MSNYTKHYKVIWNDWQEREISIEHLDNCFWEHNYGYQLVEPLLWTDCPVFRSLKACLAYHWYKESNEHHIVKKMKEWHEDNDKWYMNRKCYWKAHWWALQDMLNNYPFPKTQWENCMHCDYVFEWDLFVCKDCLGELYTKN